MLALLLVLAQTTTPFPTPEAQELGVRLARTSGLAAVAPMLVEKDLADLAREDPSLTAAERERLLAIGRAESRAGLDKLFGAIGAGYAKRLSVADLKLLVAHGESAAAARWRVAEPAVIAEAMGAVGELDLRKSVAAAMCRETGKLCKRD